MNPNRARTHLAQARNQGEVACEAAVVGEEKEQEGHEGQDEEETAAGDREGAQERLAGGGGAVADGLLHFSEENGAN